MITFGLRRTKSIKAIICWELHFDRCSETATIEGLNQMGFLEVLETASRQDLIWTQELDQVFIISKQAEPGKIKDKRKWNDWDVIMVNYLSTIHGSLGVPLSYIVRENDEPILEGHDNFIEKCVACAPLKGPIFKAYSRRVHQVISSNVQGEAAKQWIKSIKRKQNRRA